MKRSIFLAKCVVLAGVTQCWQSAAEAQRNYPPQIEGAKEIIYKEVGDTQLKLWMFQPPEAKADEKRPAVIFFFGGGWKSGTPEQFVPQSKHLIEKGMVALVADYRVASRHQTKAKDCVEDARDAMRYVRSHAAELGIDPNRLAAGGGSAGGHIAACLGVIEKDKKSKADALFLFNPACVLAVLDGKNYWGKEDREAEMKERMGVDPVELSPAHHVTSQAAPCILFHGKADAVVPFATAEIFAKKMKDAGVNCELKGYEGAGHGFFNPGRKENSTAYFQRNMKELDAFLVKLGWIGK